MRRVSPDYLRFLRPYPAEIRDLALAARALVLREAPGATELIYDAYNAVAAGYTFTGRPSDAPIHIAVYAKWVNLGFTRGADLPDPDRVLQGSGRQVRHLRLSTPADLESPVLLHFLRAAIARAPRPAGPLAPTTAVRGNYPNKRRPR